MYTCEYCNSEIVKMGNAYECIECHAFAFKKGSKLVFDDELNGYVTDMTDFDDGYLEDDLWCDGDD